MSLSAATLYSTLNQAVISTGTGSLVYWEFEERNWRAGSLSTNYSYVISQSGYYLIHLQVYFDVNVNCRAFLNSAINPTLPTQTGSRLAEMVSSSNAAGITKVIHTFSSTWYLPKDFSLGLNVLPSANCNITARGTGVQLPAPYAQIIQLTGAIS